MRPRLIVSLVLIGLLFVFAVQNAKTVDIALLFWRIEISRSLLILIVFFLGGVVGWFVRTVASRRKHADRTNDLKD